MVLSAVAYGIVGNRDSDGAQRFDCFLSSSIRHTGFDQSQHQSKLISTDVEGTKNRETTGSCVGIDTPQRLSRAKL